MPVVDAATVESRVDALRAQLKAQGLAGVIIPLTDEHMSEYVGDYAGRLAYISGFTGSAGMAIITQEKAAIFTDGRYTIQVRDQVPSGVFSYENYDGPTPPRWLANAVKAGDRIAFDGELLRIGFRDQLAAAIAPQGASLVMQDANIIDKIWHDQPTVPLGIAQSHEGQYAGESAQQKRARLAAGMAEQGIDVAPIMMLDSIAWLLNIRGTDVQNTPVVRAAALLHSDASVELFIEPEKINAEVAAHLGNRVSIQARSAYYDRLADLSAEGKRILFDKETHNSRMYAILSENGAAIIERADPCILPKAVKNGTELKGAINAHERDGVAICRFLHWLDEEAPKGALDELTCVETLWAFRQQNDLIRDWSFDTISGAGPNGAIVHYRVTEETNRKLELDSLYLVDSGGQYLDGTTDITRTIPIGTPSQEMRDRFTRVLKGHIALATTIFAPGTSGHALDAIARKPLWDAGLDYDHGTGHGVGSYLGVHEGPQRIAKFGSDVPLEPGMLLSNEPGYYKEGAFGIRIENLIYVEALDDGERLMLGFKTMTLAPIDLRLVDVTLLTAKEIGWLNRYHARVYDTLIDRVPSEIRDWLQNATRQIADKDH